MNTVVPSPGLESIQILPPFFSTYRFARGSPSPRRRPACWAEKNGV
jgi:hypothetical protein